MKYLLGRKAKRVDFAKLREITPTPLDKGLVDRVKKKVGLYGIAQILHENQGAQNISQLLENKVNVKEVATIKKMLSEDTFNAKSKFARLKFFFPYRGAWFFDIIVNRKLKENKDDELCKYFGVFLNGNSGFVRVYEMDNRTSEHITNIFNKFIQDNRQSGYPVKKIISDNEGGVPNSLGGVEIIKKTQRHTSHGTLSRINSFASKLRDFHHNEKKDDTQYITLQEVDKFVNIWNNHKVPIVNVSRIEMMGNVDLEEAYIAACMTENADVRKAVEEGFKADDLVKIRETNDEYEGNVRVMNKERTGTYKVVENKDGNLTLVNINDPEDVRTTRAMNVTKRVRSTRPQLNEYLAETNEVLPIIRDNTEQNVSRLDRTPEQRQKNRDEAQNHRTATTRTRANENKRLQEGVESMEYRDKNKDKMIDIKKLSQKERSELIRWFVQEKMKKDYNLGFLTYYTPEEQYALMEEFVKKLPQEFHAQLFDDMRFFGVSKKELGPRKLSALSDNLAQLAEHPEFRAIWNNATATADENVIINALGYFAKNKSGPKQT